VVVHVLAQDLGGESVHGATGRGNGSYNLAAASFVGKGSFNGFQLAFHASNTRDQLLLVGHGVHKRNIPPGVLCV